jgi:4-amino-4-deoxy-L-arabinose transferase-like glycosyltransferase
LSGTIRKELAVTTRPRRPPTRDIAVVFVLGIVGTLVPVIGWLIGVVLVGRASAWSRAEKAVAIVGPVVVLLVAVVLVATAFGANVRPLPLLAAVPLTSSLSSAIGAVYLAQRLVAHKRAAEARPS